MSEDWVDKIAEQLLSRGLIETPLEVHTDGSPVRQRDLLLTGQTGICLILGAADTGKTTLAAALAKYLGKHQAVRIIDADIGQSHIGPPTTVGFAPLYVFSVARPSWPCFALQRTPYGGASSPRYIRLLRHPRSQGCEFIREGARHSLSDLPACPDGIRSFL